MEWLAGLIMVSGLWLFLGWFCRSKGPDAPAGLHGIAPIRTERLLIRELRPEDWRAMHAYLSDPEVRRYDLTAPSTAWRSRMRLRILIWQQRLTPRTVWGLAVERASDGLLIGEIGFVYESVGERRVSMGYVFRRDCWGQGYGTEATRALLDIAFREAGVEKVVGEAHEENTASWKIMERLGMRRTGSRPRKAYNGPFPGLLYEITAEEWLNRE